METPGKCVKSVKSTRFSCKKNIYKKIFLKSSKTLRKYEENLQPQMPELQFLETLISPALQQLNN